MKINKRRGISLIVLVITIIVIIILAGAVIIGLVNDNPISQASKATFLSDVKNFQTELSLYETKQFSDKMGVYDPKLLQADEVSVTYDGNIIDGITMNDLILTLGKAKKYAGQFKVVNGELIFQGSNTNEQNWATEAGIEVIIAGEPTVTIIPPANTVVAAGTDVVYTVQFSSNLPLTTIDLTGKIEVLDNSGAALPVQPVVAIGTISGTAVDVTRQVDITISTNDLADGSYKLKIKAGAVANSDNISNTTDKISPIGFDIDSTPPENPIMVASPSTPTIENVLVTITYSTDSVIQEYSLDGTIWSNYTSPVIVTENNTTVYARGKKSSGSVSGVATLTVTNIDKIVPTVTYGTNGGSVQTASTTVTANDLGGSDINVSTLQYIWDTQNTIEPISGWTTFTNGQTLTKGSVTGTYYIWIKASDNAGNSITSKSNAFVIDNTVPANPTMSANPATWTNGSVVVTITYSGDSTIKEYSLNGTTWNTYTSPIAVTTNGTTVYARGKDSVGNVSGQSTLTIANIDKIVPTVAYGTNGGSGATVSTTVTVSDTGGSNINVGTLQYVWDTQNSTTPSSGWTTFTNGQTLTKGNTNGTYYLWIKASDNAGNVAVSKTNSFVLVAANKPVLAAGMTAKKWNGSTWETVSSPSTDTSWYDYGNKQWANAQTADGSMWVWIPRYEYKIPTFHTYIAQTIAINFLVGTSTTATSGYIVHPGFTFGSVQLTGTWVAKFEASGSTTAVEVKPDVGSLRNITIDEMFTACRNMETANGTRYGWGTSGTGIDTHLIKNVEWGAVVYLSQSIYGKNSEVWINPNCYYITGQAGTSVDNNSTATTYSYNNMTYGVNASTTGNIYGIYDMSGGTAEYVAAYVDDGDPTLTTYGSSLVSAASQYKDVYTSSGASATGRNNYFANISVKGEAVYETSTDNTSNFSSWYGDSDMPYGNEPFFYRGGYCIGNNASIMGTFCFGAASGYAGWGFRPVVAVSASL
jgi:hypothetical protein